MSIQTSFLFCTEKLNRHSFSLRGKNFRQVKIIKEPNLPGTTLLLGEVLSQFWNGVEH